jgi:hypothetical protein
MESVVQHYRVESQDITRGRLVILTGTDCNANKKGTHLGAFFIWWSQTGSNRRPPACKAGALPAELWPQKLVLALGFTPNLELLTIPLPSLVGLGGFEPPTSPLSGVRSNQLSYRPNE